jgi:ligand-binding SRPBCC domain-containing protein
MGSTFSFRYRFLGVWLPWEGEIIDWVPGARFVDRMCKGTFREFVHTHLFEPLPNGTLYTDAMEFTLGMGEFVDRVLGKPMLDRTVRKRHARLLEIFGTTSSAPGDGYAIDRL